MPNSQVIAILKLIFCECEPYYYFWKKCNIQITSWRDDLYIESSYNIDNVNELRELAYICAEQGSMEKHIAAGSPTTIYDNPHVLLTSSVKWPHSPDSMFTLL